MRKSACSWMYWVPLIACALFGGLFFVQWADYMLFTKLSNLRNVPMAIVALAVKLLSSLIFLGSALHLAPSNIAKALARHQTGGQAR